MERELGRVAVPEKRFITSPLLEAKASYRDRDGVRNGAEERKTNRGKRKGTSRVKRHGIQQFARRMQKSTVLGRELFGFFCGAHPRRKRLQ